MMPSSNSTAAVLPIFGQPGAPTSFPGPVNPPQVANVPFEFFSQLATVVCYTRPSFITQLHCQAPAFDPTRPGQPWFIPGVDPTQPFEYLAVIQSPGGVFNFEPWSIGPTSIPGAWAASPNIPGRPVYPPWIPAQTTLTVDGHNLVNTEVLSTEDEANALAVMLGNGVVVVPGPKLIDIGDDSRSDWMVQGGGLSSAYYVGSLLKVQYASGVGAPGEWIIVNGGGIWVPAPQAADGITSGIPTTFVSTPVRALLPNEEIKLEGLGTPLIVVH